ncbi:MAG: bifunctional glutamate N-acetyltransferase/amino-acid acetyltransferase ArgJ [Treponema sp.]|jgi:glutamate N-acetyltransferase/amino-acid N-acetyltransferase|nr:bifunctional glutamate N-acetyltransferase/amino-acid acetyltransferase ArgJ [Treponema sp.]
MNAVTEPDCVFNTIPDGGICAPKGFKACGLRAGIKESAKKRDLALVYSERPCTSAAVFTRNVVKAANIIVTGEHLEKSGGRIRALVANSGNANACTGARGLAAARRMAALAAMRLGIAPEECAVASTGVIGVPLPLDRVEAAMEALAAGLREDGADEALEAIMTTDTRKKQRALEFALPPGNPVRIGAMVKGSGMIHPNMATMIAVITTDAALSAPALDKALRRAVNRSFNRLTVDGDTSTNDIALVMANGAAGNFPVESESPAYEIFAAALESLCVDLARQMARDGEGATKLITVTVSGADSGEDADALAKSIAGSSLVKTACFGADANWGRVLCAMGYSGRDFNPETVNIRFRSKAGEVEVCRNGAQAVFSEASAKKILLEEEIEIIVELGNGAGTAANSAAAGTAWGCDLSCDYVKINGDYRT